jgi:dethiobiotin synthetase
MNHQTAYPPEGETPPRGVLVITGTGTGVGKTVVTAAIAALAHARGDRVAIVKPVQTGVHPGPGSDVPDAETIERLSGVADTHELARFPDPLSPEAAARVTGLPPLDPAYAAGYIAKLADSRDLVLVEGAGGLLVRYNAAGATLADLAATLGAPVLVVIAAGLGTLNHTALTLEAIAARKLRLAGVVIGSWPRQPDLAARENLADLETVAGSPLAGLLAEGSGSLPREAFRAAALHGLGRSLGGLGPGHGLGRSR